MSHVTRSARALLFAGLGLALVLPATASATSPHGAAGQTVTPGASVVTLITGDQVEVTQQVPGHLSVTVDMAARSPDRANPGYSQHEVGGHVYVVPADVSSLVPAQLDWSLFDVTDLVAAGLDDATSLTLPITVTLAEGASAVTLPATAATTGTASSTAGSYVVDKANADQLGLALSRAASMVSGTETGTVSGTMPGSVLDGVEHITLTGATAGPLTTATSQADAVVATAAGVGRALSTLTVNATAPDGRPAVGISSVDILNVDDQSIYQQIGLPLIGGTLSVTVPDGNYAVMGYLFTYDEPEVYAIAGAAVFDPQVAVSGDTTVTLDGQKANPIHVDTPDPVEPTTLQMDYYRTDALGVGYSHSFLLSPPINTMLAAPTDPVTIGDFEFYTQYSLIAPDVTVAVTDPVHEPVAADYAINSSKFDGTISDGLVYAGLGRTQDFEGIDVKGKIALVERGEITFLEKIQNAQDAGAKMIMIYNNVPGVLLITGDPSLIPTLAMSQDQGQKLKAYLDAGPVTLQLVGVMNSPYLYDLVFPESPIPAKLDYTVDDTDSATLTVRYRADEKDHPTGELRHKWLPWEFASFGALRQMTAPIRRTEHVSSGDIRWAQYLYAYSTPAVPFEAPMYAAPAPYEPGPAGIDNWKKQIIVAGTPFDGVSVDQAAYRSGDNFVLNIPEWVDPRGHWGWATDEDTTAFRLYQDGDLIASGLHAYGTYAVSPDDATYRIELDASRSYDWWKYSADTSTVWAFPSSHTDGRTVLPVLNIQTKKKLNLVNTARPDHDQRMRWQVVHQTGSEASEVTSSALAVSYDGGSTWMDAKVTDQGDGMYRAKLPAAPEGATAVTLRMSATDASGSSVEQTITPAYGLR